jgi:hypothetical protein
MRNVERTHKQSKGRGGDWECLGALWCEYVRTYLLTNVVIHHKHKLSSSCMPNNLFVVCTHNLFLVCTNSLIVVCTHNLFLVCQIIYLWYAHIIYFLYAQIIYLWYAQIIYFLYARGMLSTSTLVCIHMQRRCSAQSLICHTFDMCTKLCTLTHIWHVYASIHSRTNI